jgi:hypothetical protein
MHQNPLRGRFGPSRLLQMILECALGFRDAEWAVVEVSKRFFSIRCCETTSQRTYKNSKIISSEIFASHAAVARGGQSASSTGRIASAQRVRCAAGSHSNDVRKLSIYRRSMRIACGGTKPLVIARRSQPRQSDPASAPPDEENEGSDQESNNEHPDLPIESEKAELLDEKLHRFRPVVVQA